MKKFSAIVKVFLISILLSVNSFADDFLRRATDENSYISGEYQLFSKRGSPANVESKFSISPSYPIRAGNISVDHQGFKGYVRHTSEFGGHGWQVHSPFSNSSSLHLDDLSGSIIVGGSSHNKLTVSGLESHHGEDYDGPQGGGFPEPTGARDHYSYGISGTVVTVKVVSLERVNNALPDDRKLTEREIKLLQNGGEISEQRKRELTAIVEKSNPTEVPWNALPKPVSAQLGKEDVALASDGTNLFWKSIVDGAKFTAGVAIAAGATIAETAEGTWNAVTNPISTIAGVGNTLAEGLWVVGESSYGLYKSDNKIDYFYDGTVENLNAISAKISDKIEDTKANAAACGDDYICKGAIYGKPATDTASYVIGGVGTAKTLGTVEKTVQKSADNFAGDIGKNSTKVDGAKQHAIKEQEISLNFYRDSDTYTAIGQDTFDGKAIWAVKQEKLASPQPADNFTYYDTYKSIDNIQFNRSFGEQAKLEGSYLATKPNATREELAILDEWGNSMRYEAQGYIPPNEQFYAGPAAPQQGYTTQQYLSGGSEQILVRENAPVHQWTNTVIDKETGKTYSIEEFEKAFPNQIKKQKK